MTRAERNNNPGNIRISSAPWQGKLDNNTDGSFEQFETVEDGLRALIVTLRTYVLKHKKNTLRKIIGRWAPPNENNTERYVDTVSDRSGIDPDEKLTFSEDFICPIVEGICFVESGKAWVTMNQITDAWGML